MGNQEQHVQWYVYTSQKVLDALTPGHWEILKGVEGVASKSGVRQRKGKKMKVNSTKLQALKP